MWYSRMIEVHRSRPCWPSCRGGCGRFEPGTPTIDKGEVMVAIYTRKYFAQKFLGQKILVSGRLLAGGRRGKSLEILKEFPPVPLGTVLKEPCQGAQKGCAERRKTTDAPDANDAFANMMLINFSSKPL